MCARYIAFTEHVSPVLVADIFGLVEVPTLSPRYNVAPSQMVPVVGAKPDGRRGMSLFKWGFVPNWANDTSGPKPVNAKSETVAHGMMFAESFRRRRCLMPACGFYEWRTVGKKKYPLHFHMRDGQPFAFAAIWDRWAGPDGPLFTCALLTTTPNDLVREVHDRMPVILPRSAYAAWLDPTADGDALRSLLAPYPAAEMVANPANPAMNKPTFEGPECLVAPAAA
ncbi:MAG TPA: SOS response-associated peptidase [Gemmataceae bacterium]|nr:SOS response-associated peptidase [Gemmataceae bacterium]